MKPANSSNNSRTRLASSKWLAPPAEGGLAWLVEKLARIRGGYDRAASAGARRGSAGFGERQCKRPKRKWKWDIGFSVGSGDANAVYVKIPSW